MSEEVLNDIIELMKDIGNTNRQLLAVLERLLIAQPKLKACDPDYCQLILTLQVASVLWGNYSLDIHLSSQDNLMLMQNWQ